MAEAKTQVYGFLHSIIHHNAQHLSSLGENSYETFTTIKTYMYIHMYMYVHVTIHILLFQNAYVMMMVAICVDLHETL